MTIRGVYHGILEAELFKRLLHGFLMVLPFYANFLGFIQMALGKSAGAKYRSVMGKQRFLCYNNRQ